jgi:hypothetical protein
VRDEGDRLLQLIFQHLAKSVRTGVRNEGDRLLQPKVAAQQTSTGPTRMCGVSIGSSSCATSLLTSCQVRENGGEKRGRPTTTTRSSSSTNEYGTNRHVWILCKLKQLRDFFFDILPESGYYDPKLQLNERVRDRPPRVESP